MISSVEQNKVSQLFSGDHTSAYHIPRYQREYSWGKRQWEDLFDDLVENDRGYFLGSIILIRSEKVSVSHQVFELVDGQQRMTTLSLLLAAIYQRLSEYKEYFDDNQFSDYINLKHRLVIKGTQLLRVQLQIQNNNSDDYSFVLSEIGLLEGFKKPANLGNRRVYKAFGYFQERLDQSYKEGVKPLVTLFDMMERLNNAEFVTIAVETHSDAYTLFESLNNRGAPLTAVDLIKNKLLAEAGKEGASKVDTVYDKWANLLNLLGDDYSLQERFLRHFYNAYQNKFYETTNVSFATKSNLIRIYESLINNNVDEFLNSALVAGSKYSELVYVKEITDLNFKKSLIDLKHIQGSPAYMLLMYLTLEEKSLGLDSKHLIQLTNMLVKFFVRRNLTNTPPTRELDRLFITIISNINQEGIKGDKLVECVRSKLREVSASISDMDSALGGDLYLDNSMVARFVLCSLEESSMTKEKSWNLWERTSKGKFVWTIEHILPQGKNIPSHWVEMIADGDRDKANSYLDSYVHQLGNLTVSGYNSELGAKSFKDKRDRQDKDERFVGYKNGLTLNDDLKGQDKWTVESIDKRTNVLKEEVIKLFAYGGEDTTFL